MPRSLIAWLVLTACLSSTLRAQEPTSTVTGTVVDAGNRPIRGVLVFMDEGPRADTTGTVGAFRLEGIPPGEHRLNIRAGGFTPRTFRLEFTDGATGRDVGAIVLEQGPDPTATLAGRVTGGIDGRPLASAVVEVNGVRVALTAEDGSFLAADVPISWGSNRLEVHHLSYMDVSDEFWVVDPDETLGFDVVLGTVELAGIVVETAPTLNDIRMAPFYERLEKGAGRFITRADIEARDPPSVTEMLRGIPGVRVEYGGPYGVEVFFPRSPGSRSQCPSPVIYLDGLLIVNTGEAVDINALVTPEQVEGIELYGGVTTVPVEFNRSGTTCGVMVIWSR